MENKTWTIHHKQYTFDKKLGNGSFGHVYSAYRHPDNKAFAVKVVPLAGETEKKSRRNVHSVLNELRKTRRLFRKSDHIVHVYDFSFDPQLAVAYLVMELGQQDLEKHLLNRSALAPFERRHIWRQLVEIAITLHNRKIVHRDIKPQNLIVFPCNIVKLCDLGIATEAFERCEPSGTARYSAPEVVSPLPTSVLTTKADVWSWGAVLYRMTYMTPPNYKAPCHYPPPTQRASLETDLVDVLRHTLIKDPVERAGVAWIARHPYTEMD